MKTEITKIKLQLKDREIELSVSEAREIFKEFNRLFVMENVELQKSQQKEYVPYPVYSAPIIIDRNAPYWPRGSWEFWCETGSSTGVVNSCGTLSMTVGNSGTMT